MIEELADRIWRRTEFQADLHAALISSLRRSIPLDPERGPPRLGAAIQPTLDSDSVQRLLQSAISFAGSKRIEYREAAYKIAVALWTLLRDDATEFNNLRDAVHLIFGRLGNFPAVEHLFRNDSPDLRGAALPVASWLALHSHEQANRVSIADGQELLLTDFQRNLWEVLSTRRSAAISAPTSAGKSFALEFFLASSIGAGAGRWAVYVVPTRALINQVSNDLLSTARQLPGPAIDISTIPVSPRELGISSGIYVLTQERLQVLLETASDLTFDLAVIDEAQMLSDPGRGVILQTVIEEILRRDPETQLLFAAPFARVGEPFGRLFNASVDLVPRPERPVTQNLIFLDTDAVVRNAVRVDAYLEDSRIPVGILTTDVELFEEDQTLAALSFAIGIGEKNLIYAGSKSRCEQIADKVRQLIEANRPDSPESSNGGGDDGLGYHVMNEREVELRAAREELATLVREHVHREYALGSVIPSGVAFHYGNMPALVRKTIEEFFAEGKLSYLVCTSTLLHGVNLPAKNLFLLNPTKGREWSTREEIPISSFDFWNLAGRAGRLGKEFEGNVYLIDYDRWQAQPVADQREQVVVPSLTHTLTERTEEFLSFALDRDHSSGREPAVENALVKLVNAERAGRLEESLERALPDSFASRSDIAEVVQEAAAAIDVPREVTEKNITVSVFRQQEMLEYLVRRIGQKGPRRVIPVHPARPWSEAHQSLLATFKRIHTYFERKARQDRTHVFFAPLALRWMRGDPLPVLIDSAIAYRRRDHPGARTATIIRDTLDDIENQLRFRYVKYTSCYQDLLAEALRRTGNEEYIQSIPSISLYLELGAASRTMISLVGLGLSRTTAGLVAGRASNLNMDRPEALRWLSRQPWDTADISPICVREIRRVVEGTPIP